MRTPSNALFRIVHGMCAKKGLWSFTLDRAHVSLPPSLELSELTFRSTSAL